MNFIKLGVFYKLFIFNKIHLPKIFDRTIIIISYKKIHR